VLPESNVYPEFDKENWQENKEIPEQWPDSRILTASFYEFNQNAGNVQHKDTENPQSPTHTAKNAIKIQPF